MIELNDWFTKFQTRFRCLVSPINSYEFVIMGGATLSDDKFPRSDVWHFDTRTNYLKRYIKGDKGFLFSQVENACS